MSAEEDFKMPESALEYSTVVGLGKMAEKLKYNDPDRVILDNAAGMLYSVWTERQLRE